jgi:asparagine synthetase A
MLQPSAHPPKIALNVTGIEGYLNHIFYQELEQHLGLLPATEPLTVKVVIGQSLYDISYGKDATALRSQNVLNASYEISQHGKLLRKGKVDAISSYNLDRNDEFATLTSRMGSDDKVIKALAGEVAREVYLVSQK